MTPPPLRNWPKPESPQKIRLKWKKKNVNQFCPEKLGNFLLWKRLDHWRWFRSGLSWWRESEMDPCGSSGKEFACNEKDLGLIPGLGRSLGEKNGYPLQYSGLENSMDCIVHGVTKSRTPPNDFHFHTWLVFRITCWWWWGLICKMVSQTPRFICSLRVESKYWFPFCLW